jgi:hypothetical protein
VWRKASQTLAQDVVAGLDPHTQGLLLEEKEASVNQLEELGEVVELCLLAMPQYRQRGKRT